MHQNKKETDRNKRRGKAEKSILPFRHTTDEEETKEFARHRTKNVDPTSATAKHQKLIFLPPTVEKIGF